MFCSKCGSFAGDAKTCPQCGEPIQAPAVQNTAVEKFNLITAYKSMFKKYAQFSGRSRRSEYWFATLMNFIITSVIYIVTVAPRIDEMMYYDESALVAGGFGMVLISIYSLITLIPVLALYVRRLHDTGKSGWCILLGLIPFAGGLILFIFSVLDSQPGSNKYGPNPKGQ